MGDVARSLVILLISACGFEGASNGTQPAKPDARPIDAAVSVDAEPPVLCNNVTCDPHALCDPSATPPCSCPPGFDDPSMNGLSCDDIDECLTDICGDTEMDCQNTVGSYVCYTPKSCKDAHDHMMPPGDTTLYFEGDHGKPWVAYCDGEDTYLSLPQGSGKNFAQYTHNLPATTDRRTTYQRVRIDPATLTIDIKNSKYASSSGNTTYGVNVPLDTISYGVAITCDEKVTGVANVDLTGLPFVVKHDPGVQPWGIFGSHVGGTATPSNNEQTWNITGFGRCGWAAPIPTSTTAPINGNAGTSKLQLDYVVPPG